MSGVLAVNRSPVLGPAARPPAATETGRAARAQAKDADAAVRGAAADLDRAQASLLVADAELENAASDKAASRAEVARETAGKSVAEARANYDRANRSRGRAAKATATAEAEARRETAVDLKKLLDERTLAFAASLKSLRADADALRAVSTAIQVQYPHRTGAAGLVADDLGINLNNPPVLSCAGRPVDAILGRRSEHADRWLAIASSLGYRV